MFKHFLRFFSKKGKGLQQLLEWVGHHRLMMRSIQGGFFFVFVFLNGSQLVQLAYSLLT